LGSYKDIHACFVRKNFLTSLSLIVIYVMTEVSLGWILTFKLIAADRSDQITDQDLLTHLLRSLASQNDEQGIRNLSNLLREQENLLREGGSSRKSEMVSALFSNGSQGSPTAVTQHQTVSMNRMQEEMMHPHDVRTTDHQLISSVKPSISNSPPAYSEARDSSAQIKMNNFDLNDIYIDSDDGTEDLERLPVSTNLGTSSVDYPWAQQDSHQSSPPQTSGNSDSASAQSPSSSSGEAQVCLLMLFCTIFALK
jgi:hypothetical protein